MTLVLIHRGVPIKTTFHCPRSLMVLMWSWLNTSSCLGPIPLRAVTGDSRSSWIDLARCSCSSESTG